MLLKKILIKRVVSLGGVYLIQISKDFFRLWGNGRLTDLTDLLVKLEYYLGPSLVLLSGVFKQLIPDITLDLVKQLMHAPPQLHDLSQPHVFLDQRVILMQMHVLEAAHELHRLLAHQMVLIFLNLFLVDHTLLADLKLQKARDHHLT